VGFSDNEGGDEDLVRGFITLNEFVQGLLIEIHERLRERRGTEEREAAEKVVNELWLRGLGAVSKVKLRR